MKRIYKYDVYAHQPTSLYLTGTPTPLDLQQYQDGNFCLWVALEGEQDSCLALTPHPTSAYSEHTGTYLKTIQHGPIVLHYFYEIKE